MVNIVRNAARCMLRGFVTHFAEMAAPAGSEVCDAFAIVVQHATRHALFSRGLIPGERSYCKSVFRPTLFAVANENKIFCARAYVFIRVSVRFFRGFVTHFAEMTAIAVSPVYDALASAVQHAAQQTRMHRGLFAGGCFQFKPAFGPTLLAGANENKFF